MIQPNHTFPQKLTNFADDTQSLSVAESREEVVLKTQNEASNIIDFFSTNDLVNNADKAAILYNSSGKGDTITLNIGGEEIASKTSDKLLGLNIASDFTWKIHCEKLAAQLNQRVGLLRRMRFRIPVEKLLIIAEALFNSKVRYGSCVYLQPVFEKEDLKAKKTHAETEKLQVIQNKMLRMIFGYKMEDRTNMTTLRSNIQMFSINQLTCYHVLLEAYNVINYGSSDVILKKWCPQEKRHYPIRSNRMEDVKVVVPDHITCRGFAWYGAKMWNQ